MAMGGREEAAHHRAKVWWGDPPMHALKIILGTPLAWKAVITIHPSLLRKFRTHPPTKGESVF